MAINNLPLKTKLMMLAGLFVIGLAAFGAVAFVTLNEVKIGGATFTAISDARDIDGDYSPPAGFIEGARILIYQMLNDGARDRARLDELHQQFEEARKTFEETHEKYSRVITDPELKKLMEKAYEPGHRYYEIAEAKFIPLMYAGRLAEADAVRPELIATFKEHASANKALDDANVARGTKLEQDAIAEAHSRTVMLIVVALAAVGLVLALCGIIANGILTPIKATVEVLHQVARGDLSERVKTTGTDEVAQMGKALNDTIDNLSRIMSGIDADAKALTSQSDAIAETSKILGANSHETTTQAATVSSSAEQVSQNMQTVATATEEMSSSIKEISKNASEAAEVASSAARLAGSTTATMTKLSESSAQIGNVIKVITSIAGQTNLLALNATIEAARAGEAGKGFAVVANEVKELAKETAKATEEIGAKVQAIQSDAKGAVAAIEEITHVIGRINDIQNTIASAVEEQTGTTNEIARNIHESVAGSADIANTIGAVSKAASETQETAVSSQKAADELSQLAAKLDAIVSKFKLADVGQHANGLISHH